MSRGGVQKHFDTADDVQEIRQAFDQAQLDPAMHAGCTAAIEYLRICAAAHGSHPPPISSQLATTRAAMSAISQHWQALARACE